jgi:hypothetical protein
VGRDRGRADSGGGRRRVGGDWEEEERNRKVREVSTRVSTIYM